MEENTWDKTLGCFYCLVQ